MAEASNGLEKKYIKPELIKEAGQAERLAARNTAEDVRQKPPVTPLTAEGIGAAVADAIGGKWADMLKSFGAGQGDGSLTNAQRESYGLPKEIPTTRQGWIDATRKMLIAQRKTKESEYAQTTWPQKVRLFLSPMPRINEDDEQLVEHLVAEATLFQDCYKLGGIAENASQTTKGIESFPDALSHAKVALNPDLLIRFRDLSSTPIPEYLERAFKDENVSLSECVDRALWLEAGFLGIWADVQGGVSKKVEKAVAKEMKSVPVSDRLDPKKWEDRVKKPLKLLRGEMFKSPQFRKLESDYTDLLGVGNDEGLVRADVVKGICAAIPKELEGQLCAEKGYDDLVAKLKTGQAMRLSELFGNKNIFCESGSGLDQEFTRWMIGALAGSNYAEYFAMDIMFATLEASRLNTTEDPGAVASDSVTHLFHPDLRMAGEGKKGAPVGSAHVAGRFPPVLKSYLQATKIGDVPILQSIRNGEKFTQLRWESLSRTQGMGYAAVDLQRGLAVYKMITDAEIDLDKLGDEGMRALIKPFGTAWGDWRKENPEDKRSAWERREKWARSHLDNNDQIKDTKKLGDDDWSPPVAWAVGVAYAHHPISALLPEELMSPYGIEPSRANPAKKWSHLPVTLTTGGSLSSPEVKTQNIRSIHEFLDDLVENQLLTPGEVLLVRELVKVGKTKSLFFIPPQTLMLRWRLPDRFNVQTKDVPDYEETDAERVEEATKFLNGTRLLS